MGKREHTEAIKSYLNGNISKFKEYINSLNRIQFLELLDVCADYRITKQKMKKLIK